MKQRLIQCTCSGIPALHLVRVQLLPHLTETAHGGAYLSLVEQRVILPDGLFVLCLTTPPPPFCSAFTVMAPGMLRAKSTQC